MNEQEIDELLERGERKKLDCKAAMGFEGDERLSLTKDILAMANTVDGGDLLFGIKERDSTREFQPDLMRPL